MTEQTQHNDDDDDNNENDVAEQVRVTFTLDSTIKDSSLDVPSEPIAIPSNLRRKGLSAIINHLLDRRISNDDDNDSNDEDDDDDDASKLPAVTFDFMICGKLLRTGVETAARRFGLSLEESIQITYFPAQEAPNDDGESEPLPDWISCLSYTNETLCSAGYDGTLRVHRTLAKDKENQKQLQTVASIKAHDGPIKCLASCAFDGGLLIATGSLDQTLVTHRYNGGKSVVGHAHFREGHTSAIGCVDFDAKTHMLVSGDWDGGMCVWNTQAAAADSDSFVDEAPTKKSKSGTGKAQPTLAVIQPLAVFGSAHSSQISGAVWMADGKHVITGSWDHSVKVWSVESQDCLLTLNGSRVVSCMDLSTHSEVVATGHPDCTIRLWDVRTSTAEAASLVSDTTLKPSHKAWVSSVRWSPTHPYILSSTSHDGTLKLWDIRSSLPLHTVRVHAKEEKSLCSVYGNDVIYVAGTDCVVKQYTC